MGICLNLFRYYDGLLGPQARVLGQGEVICDVGEDNLKVKAMII